MLEGHSASCGSSPQVAQRYIILDGVSSLGAEVAVTISASPFLRRLSGAPLTSCVLLEAPDAASELSLSERISEVNDVLAFEEGSDAGPPAVPPIAIVGAPSSAHKLATCCVSDTPYVHNSLTDVFVLVAGPAATPTRNAAILAQVAGLVDSSKGASLILIVADATYRETAALINAEKRFASWQICTVRAALLSPRLRWPRAPVFVGCKRPLSGTLENVCLGVLLGVVRRLPIYSSLSAPFVPIDMAVHTGLLAHDGLASGMLPHSVENSKRVTVVVRAPVGEELSWGMLSEYLMDYLGRYIHQIHDTFPAPDIIEKRPSLRLWGTLADALNYSFSLMSPVHAHETYATRQRRDFLTRRYPQSTTTLRITAALTRIDASLSVTASLAAAQTPKSSLGVIEAMRAGVVARKSGWKMSAASDEVESGVALHLLLQQAVLRNAALAPHAPLMTLQFMEWESYVKRVCVAVLQHINAFFLRGTAHIELPVPSPLYHNDLVFHGGDRVPRSILFPRRWAPEMHWLLRCGMTHNGSRSLATPGMTEKRMQLILSQPHIHRAILQAAEEQKTTEEAVQCQATAILTRIGDTLNQKYTRVFGVLIRKIFFKLFDQAYINEEAFHTLFHAFRVPRTTVVLIPTHRSYMDFLVVSYMLIMLGLPLPHICGGEDFLQMGPMVKLFRGSGAFFMRRSFRDDKLYSALFREYVRQLVVHNQTVEFFIEGMRSRTGKTLPPKLGILKFITDAYFQKQCEIDDILFVPFSLSYDELLEKNVYANELLGIPKPKESIGNLLKAKSILNRRYGAMNVNVGKPISLKSFVANPLQCPPSYEPGRAATAPGGAGKEPAMSLTASLGPSAGCDPRTPALLLEKMAWRITHDLQRNLVVTPTALVSAAIQAIVGSNAMENGVPLTDLASCVAWVRSAVAQRSGAMNSMYESLDSVALTQKGLYHLQPQVRCNGVRSSGEDLVQCCEDAATQIVLSMFTAQLLHLFIDEAIVVVATVASGAVPMGPESAVIAKTKVPGGDADDASVSSGPVYAISRQRLMEACKFLRRLLHWEFPDLSPSSPIGLDTWLSVTLERLHKGGIVSSPPSEDQPSHLLYITGSRSTMFLSQLLYPYVESLFLIGAGVAVVTDSGRGRISERDLLRMTQRCGLHLHGRPSDTDSSRLVEYSQSCSRETVKSGMAALLDLGILAREKNNPEVVYLAPSNQEAAAGSFVTEINRYRFHPASTDELVVVGNFFKSDLVEHSGLRKSQL